MRRSAAWSASTTAFSGLARARSSPTSLVALRGFGLTRATAVTKLLNFTSNVASVLFFALGGKMLVLLGLCMAAGAMLGGWLGSIARYASARGLSGRCWSLFRLD